ncbi:hypothetical protein [Aequorivita echinoideorum]|uniref:Lipocalin-like domain-containing protein n=1 Tax=Aequorivita echinoideorum TaxID=1549647 RepID=A0ABS5S149_9FLAO|nr:hypothetical protein [Aequorivita echinoideorum]MBT0606936.1 hypothetical protein [Aequorivita echinoideorum]
MKMIVKTMMLFALLATSCNKDDDGKEEQGCVKEENFFEAQFDGTTIEPHYAQGGGFGVYTLNFNRCSENEGNWYLSVNTENNGPSFYLYLINVNSIGNYSIEAGDSSQIPAFCDEVISLYIRDEINSTYSFISSENGQVEITRYDNNLGILVGTFTAELVSTADPSVKKTITGEFNLNKSTLDNTQKPCFLD